MKILKAEKCLAKSALTKPGCRDLLLKIKRFLEQGKVLILPTDTIYGLVADVRSEKAVKKIFKIKNRSFSKAMPVFVNNISGAKKLAHVSKTQERFLKKVWPGKVTAVLKRKKHGGLPKILFGKKETIGLRMPDYALLNEILETTKMALAETSVNLSGQPPLKDIAEMRRQFSHKKYRPDVIIDAGRLKPSKPSLVIDISGSQAKILRRA